eukprot:scaffold6027_cov117-Isochrysis_galbana.AAC.4
MDACAGQAEGSGRTEKRGEGSMSHSNAMGQSRAPERAHGRAGAPLVVPSSARIAWYGSVLAGGIARGAAAQLQER